MSSKNYRGERLILNNFSDRDLTGADFQDTILFCCDFSGANLHGANFANATLVTCNFDKACLIEADFRIRSRRTCSFRLARLDRIILPPDKMLGNPLCIHNARSPFLRCAINPSGPCEDCQDFEQVS